MLLDKVLYEMDEEAEEELDADLVKAQKYVERLGGEGGMNVAVDKVYVDKVEKVASRYIRRLMMIWTRRRSRASKGTRGGEEGCGMKGIVVEIATLINAPPPHHTCHARHCGQVLVEVVLLVLVVLSPWATIGTLPTALVFNKGCFSTTLSLKVLVLLSASRYTAL